MAKELKTSAEWLKIYEPTGMVILDPDGWDRKNYNYSFKEELVTEVEFNRRLMYSTVMYNKDKHDL